MRLLLDTHVFIWYISAEQQLPAKFHAAIQDSNNEVFVSAVSVWESVIKHSLGKMQLVSPPAEFLPEQREKHGMFSLPVDEGALPFLASLPPIHRDPFDRILVAQALQNGLTIVSVDPAVLAYPVASLPVG